MSLGKGNFQTKSVQNSFDVLGERNLNMDRCCTGVHSGNFGSPRSFVEDPCQFCWPIFQRHLVKRGILSSRNEHRARTASASPRSLLWMPQWLGIHCSTTSCPEPVTWWWMDCICCTSRMQSIWRLGDERACKMVQEPVKIVQCCGCRSKMCHIACLTAATLQMLMMSHGWAWPAVRSSQREPIVQ